MKDVQVKNNSDLTVPQNCFGAGDDISTNDIRIGRIALMQSSSDLVKKELARTGAFVDLDSTTELAYRTEKPLQVILIKSFKYWIEKIGDKFHQKIPANDPMELPREEGNINRMYHHAFFVLLPSEIDQGIEMPYEIAFRSTDLVTAQRISKILLNMRRQEIASWDKVFDITALLRTKDKHSWLGTELKVGRDSSLEERAKSYQWYQQVQNAVKLNVTQHEDENNLATDFEDVRF